MSGDESFDTVLNGILHGACDFLVKPVRLVELRNIWQHLVRRWVAERDEDGDAAGKGEEKGVEKKKPRVGWTAQYPIASWTSWAWRTSRARTSRATFRSTGF